MSIYADTNRKWTFLLEIAGLPIRYYSHAAPPTTELPGITGVDYTDRFGIVGVGDLSSSLDPLEGIAQYGQIDITLASDGRYTDYTDPVSVFSRLGPRSATAFAQVVTEISSRDSALATIAVDRDLSALSYPRLVHVGQESFWVTAFSGVDNTLTVSSRAVINTRQATHKVDEETADFPKLITDEVVFWRSRRAVLKAARLNSDGTPGDYVELMRGFIDLSPTIQQDGLSITVGLVPLISLLEKEADFIRPTTTKLVEGYHLFQDGIGSAVDVYMHKPGAIFEDLNFSEVWTGRAHTAGAAGEGAIYAGNANVYSEMFDVTLDPAHPRAGSVLSQQHPDEDPVDITAIASAAFEGELTTDPADPSFAIAANELLYTDNPGEIRRAFIINPGDPDEVLLWPGTLEQGLDGVFGRLNAALEVDTVAGDAGAWLSMTFSSDGEEHELLTETTSGLSANAEVNFPTARFPANKLNYCTVPAGLSPIWGNGNGYFFGDRDEEGVAGDISTWFPTEDPPRTWSGGVDSPGFALQKLLHIPWYVDKAGTGHQFFAYQEDDPIDENLDGPVREFFMWNRVLSTPRPVKLECATAWYQQGEDYILVDDNISVGTYSLSLPYYNENVQGQAGEVIIEVSAVDPLVLVGGPRDGDTVYQCTVTSVTNSDDGQPTSFAIWPESARTVTLGQQGRGRSAETTYTPLWTFDSSLVSASGDAPRTVGGVLETLLTDPDLFGWTTDDVNVASLYAIPEPGFGEWYLPSIPEKTSLVEFLKGVLFVTRSALVMRTDSAGNCKVTRVDLSGSSAAFASVDINNGDWATNVIPTWGSDDSVINQIILNTNYNPATREFPERGKYIINSFEFQSLIGEARSEELDLYALRNVDPTELGLAMQSVFVTYGYPRRIWRGVVGTAKGLLCNLASTVEVSSPFLRGFTNEQGVTNEAAMVLEQNIKYWEEGCSLVLSFSGARVAGWNAAMRVATVPTATTVTVETNEFSEEVHPYTGETSTDLRVFMNNDTSFSIGCNIMDPYDQDNFSTATINSVDFDTNTVTFSAAHGASVGDIIEPRRYGTAPFNFYLESLAYLSDAAGTLGAGGDEGLEYS